MIRGMDERPESLISAVASRAIDATAVIVILALAVPMTYGIVIMLVDDGSLALAAAMASPLAGPVFIWGIVRWTNARRAKRPISPP